MRRQAQFYRALRDMGRAMVTLTDPAELYRTICSIAVDHGNAGIAWIGLIQDGHVVPVAWGGEHARDYTEGMDIRVAAPDESDADLGPTAWALRRGVSFICNRFEEDPRTAPFRERGMRFGVRSSGAFPVRRNAGVIGTLNLYFPYADAFDPALVELVEQMVSDLCFALEHIDREAARARAEREAREREQQLSGIVETALDAIITVDARQRIVLFNRSAAGMFGVSPEEAIGSSLERFIPPEHRLAHRGHVQEFASRWPGTRRMGHAREVSGLRATGEVFPMEASISKVGEGEHMLMTVMARDVTQLRQAEKAHLARAAAEAANRAKTEFLSRISHELRTPLNAVLGFTQLLKTDPREPLQGRQLQHVDLVLQAASHLRTLIDEMLDVSRIEAGRMTMDAQDFELCELLDGVIRMSEPHAESCHVRLEAGYRPGGCPTMLRTDPARLRQVMLNLLSNAIKYNRPGGRVRVEVDRDPYFVHIVVRDNGLGMSEEQRASLFQPFNRLGRESSGVEGTGIGLVLVRQLVGLLGGELTLRSEEGQGTVVTVTLAAGGAPATAKERPSAAGRGQAGPTEPRKRSEPQEPLEGVVLYIEDNAINAILVEQLLARWPQVQTVIAPDGATGIEQARALQPDLILLDMQLPDTDGVSVLRQLKSDPATRELPVVALSAAAVEHDVQAARAAGAIDYWTKPIDFDRFLEGMHSYLHRR